MEKLITIYNTEYAIPAVFSYSQKHEKTIDGIDLPHFAVFCFFRDRVTEN